MKLKQVAGLLFLGIMALPSFSQTAKLHQQIINEVFKPLRHIQMSDLVQSYFDKSSPEMVDSSIAIMYFNEYSDGSLELRLKVYCISNFDMQMTSDCQFIADKNIYLIDGGQIIKKHSKEYSYGYFDIAITPEILNAICAIISAQKPKIRYNDETGLEIDRLMGKSEIAALKNILTAYQEIKIHKCQPHSLNISGLM